MMDQCDLFVFSDDRQFVKNSWQTRNRIKTRFGVRWLSVSVDSNHAVATAIKDIRVKHEAGWVERNLCQLKEAYRKAPFFQPHFDGIAEILQRKQELLADVSISLVRFVAQQLGIRTPMLRSSELKVDGRSAERIVNTCKVLGASEYFDGATGRELYDPQYFATHGVKIYFHEYEHPVYRQLHGEFVSHLSAVDLLFNEGPNSMTTLRSGRRNRFDRCG